MGSENKKKALTLLGAALCVILIPILVINLTLIIKSYTNTEEVPTLGGYCPLIVLTGSMEPEISSGDMIICHTIEPSEVKTGDVISFFDPEGNGLSVVTHRVVEIVQENGSLSFRTKGDANNVEDKTPVPAENLVGIYQTRIRGAGNLAMFMQSTPGFVVCVGLPLLCMVIYDLLRRRRYEKSKKEDTDALLAELEMLRKEKAEKEELMN